MLVRLHTTTWSWLAGNSATLLMATSPDDDTWGGLGREGGRGGQGAAGWGRNTVNGEAKRHTKMDRCAGVTVR